MSPGAALPGLASDVAVRRTASVGGRDRAQPALLEVLDAFEDFQKGRLGSIPASYGRREPIPHGDVRGEAG